MHQIKNNDKWYKLDDIDTLTYYIVYTLIPLVKQFGSTKETFDKNKWNFASILAAADNLNNKQFDDFIEIIPKINDYRRSIGLIAKNT